MLWFESIRIEPISFNYFRNCLIKKNKLKYPIRINSKIQRKLFDVKKLAFFEFLKWGIPDWELIFVKANYYGICYHDEKIIGISSNLIQAGLTNELIKDTILHEIAHAIDFLHRGYTNHDDEWKRWCEVTGANTNTTYEYPDKLSRNLSEYSKYYSECPRCKAILPWFRLPKRKKKCYKCKKNKIVSYIVLFHTNEPKKFDMIV